VKFSSDVYFSASPKDYLIDMNTKDLGDICVLGLTGDNIGIYILGETFLRSFISVYDFDNKRVGLAPAI
jgi:hypothetical protein